MNAFHIQYVSWSSFVMYVCITSRVSSFNHIGFIFRLVSGSGDIKITKDGNILLHEMVRFHFIDYDIKDLIGFPFVRLYFLLGGGGNQNIWLCCQCGLSSLIIIIYLDLCASKIIEGTIM